LPSTVPPPLWPLPLPTSPSPPCSSSWLPRSPTPAPPTTWSCSLHESQPAGPDADPPLEPQRLTAQLEAEPGTQVRRRPFITGQVSSRRAGTCTLHPIRCSSTSSPASV